MAELRSQFSGGAQRDREVAIHELTSAFGVQRIGPRIREEAETALRTAVRRGILDNERGELRLRARSIEGYDRAFLKEQFLSSLGARRWVERADAGRGFARWMGFRRAGASIVQVSRSLINGLIREGRLESNGQDIRSMNT